MNRSIIKPGRSWAEAAASMRCEAFDAIAQPVTPGQGMIIGIGMGIGMRSTPSLFMHKAIARAARSAAEVRSV